MRDEYPHLLCISLIRSCSGLANMKLPFIAQNTFRIERQTLCFWASVLGHVFHQIAANLIDACGWFLIDGSGCNLIVAKHRLMKGITLSHFEFRKLNQSVQNGVCTWRLGGG